jgi:Flp pilus assembly protein TadD
MTSLVVMALLYLQTSSTDLQKDLLSIQEALQSGDWSRASHLIEDSMQHHPNEGGLLNLRGVLHAERNEASAARQDFTEAVRLSPDLTPAWQNLARICQLEAKQDSAAGSCAADAWEHVAHLKPGDKETLDSLRQLVIAEEQANRPVEARKTLEQVAVLDPKNPAHLLELARLADASKDYEGALGYLAHARDLTPRDPQIHFLFAEVAMEMDLVMQAQASLHEALALEPNNPAYNYAMGFVTLQTRGGANAVGYFQKFVAVYPGNPKGHYALGIAYYASGDYEKSKTEMHAVENDPKTAGGAHYFLGRMARQEGDLDSAQRHLQRSTELLPQFSESHTELARIWMQQGDLVRARTELDRAVQLDPQSFAANMQLLVVYRRTHDPRAAAQSELVKKLDETRSMRAELALRTVEAHP